MSANASKRQLIKKKIQTNNEDFLIQHDLWFGSMWNNRWNPKRKYGRSGIFYRGGKRAVKISQKRKCAVLKRTRDYIMCNFEVRGDQWRNSIAV